MKTKDIDFIRRVLREALDRRLDQMGRNDQDQVQEDLYEALRRLTLHEALKEGA